MIALALLLALAVDDGAPVDEAAPAPAEAAPTEAAPAPSLEAAPAEVAPAPLEAARAEAPGAPVIVAPERERATTAAWTVAGASAAGFVGGALFAVPAVLSFPASVELALAIGLPSLALGAAFGAFVAELGVARLGTSLAVSGIAGGGALMGAALGLLAGYGVGSLARSQASDPAPILGALAGGAVGGIAGTAVAGGLGAYWLTPDER